MNSWWRSIPGRGGALLRPLPARRLRLARHTLRGLAKTSELAQLWSSGAGRLGGEGMSLGNVGAPTVPLRDSALSVIAGLPAAAGAARNLSFLKNRAKITAGMTVHAASGGCA